MVLEGQRSPQVAVQDLVQVSNLDVAELEGRWRHGQRRESIGVGFENLTLHFVEMTSYFNAVNHASANVWYKTLAPFLLSKPIHSHDIFAF